MNATTSYRFVCGSCQIRRNQAGKKKKGAQLLRVVELYGNGTALIECHRHLLLVATTDEVSRGATGAVVVIPSDRRNFTAYVADNVQSQVFLDIARRLGFPG